jgi:glycosyltransferase involved in cell wall biosynthesis
MNIWIFNHYAITPDMAGGTRHYDLASELVCRGHRVTIIASGFSHKQLQEGKVPPARKWSVQTANGVRFVWLKTFPYRDNNWRRVLNMVSYTLRAWKVGRKLPLLVPDLEKPNVVIGSSVHLLAVLAAYWVAKHHKAKFIMEVRDLWPQTIIDMGKLSEQSPITKALQALEKYLYRRAEKIITLLPLAEEYITACGISRDKIIWIPNGVDISRFDGGALAGAQRANFRVMYIGAHGQANALDVLLRAAKIIQDAGSSSIRFVLVGDGPEKPRLIELRRELGLSNVEFRDSVAKEQVPKVIEEADATVFILNDLTIYRYGISLNKLYDYLAAKRPLVLAGNPVNNPVEEARCGLTVPPCDPEALAAAIIDLSRISKDEREAMGRRGREYVEKYHSIPMLADKLIECIEEGWVH